MIKLKPLVTIKPISTFIFNQKSATSSIMEDKRNFTIDQIKKDLIGMINHLKRTGFGKTKLAHDLNIALHDTADYYEWGR